MTLNKILEEMATNRPYAEMDITLGNDSTHRARVGQKKAAQETISRLKATYKEELLKSTAFIIVTGSGRDAFSELAATEAFGCFLADADDFYKDLVARISPPSIKPSLYTRENTKNLFNVAQNVLREKASELGVRSYLPLYFSEKYNRGVKTAEEFLPLLKTAMTEQVGTEMIGLNAVNAIVDEAIKRNYSAAVTPIVFNVEDGTSALSLQKDLKKHTLKDGTTGGLTDNVFLVIVGTAPKAIKSTEGAFLVKTVSEETVGEALSKISNKIL
jgi:hypothetical protein